jgi:SM-20-related protein
METHITNIVEDIYEKGFCVADAFLNLEQQQFVINHFNQSKKEFKQASIGQLQLKQTNSDIRKDKIAWLEETDDIFVKIIDPFLSELIIAINRRCFMGINANEFMLAIYEKNDFYKKHRDAFQQNDERKLSIIIYLNPNWKPEDGGELLLYLENGTTQTIAPMGGRLVIFESYLEHEVLPTQTSRLSLTGWLKRE